jgi:hypothetical protein
MIVQKSLKDLLSGLIFIGLGLAFGYAAFGYEFGTALRMGPGYFPLVLSGIMVLLGVVITVQSFAAGPDATPIGRVPRFALMLIIGALIFFGVTVRGLGLVPALFVTIFMSAFASERTGLGGAFVLAACLTLICFLIFVWALGLPLRVFGPWLSL